jgi:hypothetical protein
MCNHKKRSLVVYNRLGGRTLENCFPRAFIEKRPPSSVQVGHCLYCGLSMRNEDMYPFGKTPRYMHDGCYSEIAFCGPKYNCLTCGEPLPQGQINAQMRNPRELTHALHPGACEDYHSALAGIIFGVPFRTNPMPILPEPGQWYEQRSPVSSMQDLDIVDMEPVQPPRRLKVLKLLK